ncbi:hypothetical protein HYS93_03620 [Candidatus Daviesbacteria bacterium]|nr:hypothetical protein [Candidatus Daviesbacteria bacterium]
MSDPARESEIKPVIDNDQEYQKTAGSIAANIANATSESTVNINVVPPSLREPITNMHGLPIQQGKGGLIEFKYDPKGIPAHKLETAEPMPESSGSPLLVKDVLANIDPSSNKWRYSKSKGFLKEITAKVGRLVKRAA